MLEGVKIRREAKYNVLQFCSPIADFEAVSVEAELIIDGNSEELNI